MNTAQLTHEGDAHSTPAGRYSVNVINNGTAAGLHLYRVTVTAPGFTPQPAFERGHDRPFGHTDQGEAQKVAEHYAAGLVELLAIEQGATITDERIAEVASGVKANLEQVDAARQADADRVTAAVEQITADPNTSWAAFRLSLTRRPAKTTEPQDRVLASADSRGWIVRGKTATSKQLIALAHGGHVRLERRRTGNTHRIAGAWLVNVEGRVAA